MATFSELNNHPKRGGTAGFGFDGYEKTNRFDFTGSDAIEVDNENVWIQYDSSHEVLWLQAEAGKGGDSPDDALVKVDVSDPDNLSFTRTDQGNFPEKSGASTDYDSHDYPIIWLPQFPNVLYNINSNDNIQPIDISDPDNPELYEEQNTNISITIGAVTSVGDTIYVMEDSNTSDEIGYATVSDSDPSTVVDEGEIEYLEQWEEDGWGKMVSSDEKLYITAAQYSNWGVWDVSARRRPVFMGLGQPPTPVLEVPNVAETSDYIYTVQQEPDSISHDNFSYSDIYNDPNNWPRCSIFQFEKP